MENERVEKVEVRPEARVDVGSVFEPQVRAALEGSLEAFGILYERTVRLVHAVCFDTAGDLETAHDLVHETFLRAHRNLKQLRRPGKFLAWLLAIAHRTCRDWQRRRWRDRHRFVGLDSSDFARPAPEPEDERLHELREALRMLPAKERVVLHAFYLEGESVERARSMSGLSRSGFYRVLERARNRLQRLLLKER